MRMVKKMKKINTKELVFAALFLALGIALPQLFARNPEIGQIALPMHFTVMLCGLICGAKYGGMCGALTPLLSSFFIGKPPLIPIGIPMIFELCTYGIIIALIYSKRNVYISLIGAMIGGRIVYGIASAIVFGVKGIPYGFEAFIIASVVKPLPGIIAQIIIIPVVMIALTKSGIITRKEAANG